MGRRPAEPGKSEEKRTEEPQNRRISNVEGRNSVDFIKKTERSDTTLRHSAVRHSTVLRFAFYILPSTFCGSTFDILRFAFNILPSTFCGSTFDILRFAVYILPLLSLFFKMTVAGSFALVRLSPRNPKPETRIPNSILFDSAQHPLYLLTN